MGNKSYEAGRRWEYAIIKKIKEKSPDALITRTAGSHGIFDVWGIVPSTLQPEYGELHLIQAKDVEKINKDIERDWEKIKNLMLPKHLIVKPQLWIKLPRNHVIAWGA